MDVIFDWNLGNMIYHGLITLQLCGFPFTEIGVVSVLTTKSAQKEVGVRLLFFLLRAHLLTGCTLCEWDQLLLPLFFGPTFLLDVH